MQDQILRRTCDNPTCDTQMDLVIGKLRPPDEKEMSNWIILTKEHVLVSGQQPQPLTKIACCATCATEIIRNRILDVPRPRVDDALGVDNFGVAN